MKSWLCDDTQGNAIYLIARDRKHAQELADAEGLALVGEHVPVPASFTEGENG